MVKKKRQRKLTVYCSIEGQKTEAALLEYLKGIYGDLNTMSFPDNPLKGGNPDRIVSFAIENSHYDRSFAWIDEDIDLIKETRQKLAQCWNLDDNASKEILSVPLKEIQKKFNSKNRNPVLIISQPICVEALILRVLGKILKYPSFDESVRASQIKSLKSALSGVMGSSKPLEYYKDNLNRDILEEQRKQIPELDLLIKMISK